MSIGERLKKLRLEAGLNKRQVAEKLDMPYTTYNNYETDARSVGSDTLKLFSKFYKVSIDYILENINEDAGNYYLNEDAGELAQEMFDRPEMRVLFDASRNVSREDILDVANLLKKLQQNEGE